MTGVIENVPRGTLALVGSRSIDANSVEAYIRSQFLALVHVLAHLVLRVIPHARRADALRVK